MSEEIMKAISADTDGSENSANAGDVSESTGREISLIGIGPGNPELLTVQAVRTICNAELLIGAARMIETAKEVRKKYTEICRQVFTKTPASQASSASADTAAEARSFAPADKDSAAEEAASAEGDSSARPVYFESYKPDEIAAYLDEHFDSRKIAFLYSGDIGVFSGAGTINRILKPDDKVQRIPGISAADYMADKLGLDRSEMKIVSLHGRKTDLTKELQHTDLLAVLLDGTETLQEACLQLLSEGYGNTRIYLGELLSYPDEKIAAGTPEEFRDEICVPLSILLIRHLRS
jgi:precorrin-6y C5,15-methyltransferase (decarboxylating) CbiE subunit